MLCLTVSIFEVKTSGKRHSEIEIHYGPGTEFVIGPLFLKTGVSAFDLLVGLLLGNMLAVIVFDLIRQCFGHG